MLSNLFQDTDILYLMDSDNQKRPVGGWFSHLSDVPDPAPAYFAINPLDPSTNRNTSGAGTPRASINVTAFRNFLFEIDSLDSSTQLDLLMQLQTKIPFASVTYSGGNSFHAIVSVLDTLPFKPHTETGIKQYSQAWRALNAELTSLASAYLGASCPGRLFDSACKDPARLSRTPNALRPDTGNVQSPVSGFGGYVSSDDVLALMQKHGFGEIVSAPKVEPCSEMDLELFKLRLCYPENRGLKSTLNRVDDWAGSENMYPKLLQLTLWIIDALGAPPATTLAYMRENIFPVIHAHNYPRNPEIGVYNAYIYKGLL